MSKVVRLTQLDGKLPNLALMRLSAFHDARGDEVHFHTSPTRGLFEPEYDVVYASAIFSFSAPLVERLRLDFPAAIVGGTWNQNAPDYDPAHSIEPIVKGYPYVSYAHWPDFTASIGFSQRGCRFNCGFCGVPRKEGKPKPAGTIHEIWRGPGHPKHIHLLDNDFFGNPLWRERIAEIRDGGFKVCFNQGINVRILTNEVARALATVEYRDDQFQRRRLYTAWDNIGHERSFFRGVDRLEAAGIPPTHLMAFMLVGYAKDETWDRIWHRFNAMVARGIRPFPMVFEERGPRPDLNAFQRWVIRRQYLWRSFDDYLRDPNPERRDGDEGDLFEDAA